MAKDDLIDDIKEFHKDDKVKFVLKVPTLSKIDNILKTFKLTSSLSCSNYVLFSATGQIKKYKNELEILEEFYPIRLALYHKRKAH
jgi:DNA topoisomerase-2